MAAAAATLAADPELLTDAELKLIFDRLRRIIARTVPPADVDDVAMTVLLRVYEHGQEKLRRADSPIAWLTTVARHSAIDHMRSGRVARERLHGDLTQLDEPSADDEIARRLDEQASAQLIRKALALAVEDKSAAVVRVVTYMLDHLQEYGDLPTQREVGAALGVSHTAVQKSLGRFRVYLTEAAGESLR